MKSIVWTRHTNMYLSEHIAWCPKNKRHPPGAIFTRGQNSSSLTNIARDRESQQAGRAQKILELGSTLFPYSPSFPLQGESKPDWGDSQSSTTTPRVGTHPPDREVCYHPPATTLHNHPRLQVYHHPSENSRPDCSCVKRTSDPFVVSTILAELERACVATQPDSSRVKRTAGIFVILTVLVELEQARIATRPNRVPALRELLASALNSRF